MSVLTGKETHLCQEHQQEPSPVGEGTDACERWPQAQHPLRFWETLVMQALSIHFPSLWQKYFGFLFQELPFPRLFHVGSPVTLSLATQEQGPSQVGDGIVVNWKERALFSVELGAPRLSYCTRGEPGWEVELACTSVLEGRDSQLPQHRGTHVGHGSIGLKSHLGSS